MDFDRERRLGDQIGKTVAQTNHTFHTIGSKMNQTIAIALTLAFVAAGVFSQTPNQGSSKNQKLKTARIHIDGFSKSKSGAV